MPSPTRRAPAIQVTFAAALLALAACSRADPGPSCGVLFGRPNAATGLSSDQCAPQCACAAPPFAPPSYDDAFIASLVSDWQLATPFAQITSDPYAAPAPAPEPAGTVCAVVPRGAPTDRPRAYDLATFPSEDAARAASASPTHFGACGVCSTLANLAVYMRENDLTAPVRSCGLASDDKGVVGCLQKLGFDLPCAQIWAFNVAHTRATCLDVCLANLTKPYNLEDGSLNPCIACDEQQSGPVFKTVAGRTRRNSGLPNAICRPCSEVQPLVHRY